jgi:hypothetical protein
LIQSIGKRHAEGHGVSVIMAGVRR